MKKLSTLIALVAIFSLGMFSTASLQAQPACQAGFVYSIGNTTPNGTSVSFFDSSFTNGTITNWNWVFGNGTGSSLQNPVTSFQPGFNYVCLTITSVFQNITCTSTICDTIIIPGNAPCNAGFSYNISPAGVQFSPAVGNNTSYSWDFGDGSTGFQAYPTHTYSAPGNYVVCLTVVDANGQTCTSCITISVPNTTGCQANFYWYNDTINGGIQFVNTSTGGGFNSWNLGNGQTSNLQDPWIMYNANGVYTVCLTIYDSLQSCTSTYCDSVVVSNGSGTGCNANFTYQAAPTGATFFSAATQSNATWTWDFGDNTFGTGANVTHTYAPGTYTACLTVTTNGISCTSCQTFTIQTNSGCSSNFALYPDTVIAHNYFLVNLATGAAPLTYLWTWGDGTSSTGATPSHTYAAGGLYTICLTITDANGCTSNTCYPFQLLRLMGSVPVTINVILGPTGINENAELSGFNVYPNPAADRFTAEFSLEEPADVTISILNLSGQAVQKITSENLNAGSHSFKIDATELSKGLYFLEISRNGQKSCTKIMLQ